MKAIITCKVNGTRFYLTEKGYASDNPSRAAEYRDRTDADIKAAIESKDFAWRGQFDWHGAYILANKKIADPQDERKGEGK